MTWTEFETAYDSFYVRYPLDGHESDEVELSLFEKYAGRIALHREIWDQVLTKVTQDVSYIQANEGKTELIGPVEAVRRVTELLRRHRKSDAATGHR